VDICSELSQAAKKMCANLTPSDSSKKILDSFYALLDTASGYAISQVFGFPTIRRYRELIREHFPQGPNRRILEIGCGVGSSRTLFACDYTGIDINPRYIQRARRRFSGRFEVMDASQMPFEPDTFDDAITIATTHHLSDDELSRMISKAVVVAKSLHLIDAILPTQPNSRFKRALFRMDRGRHVRTFEQICDIVSRNAQLKSYRIVEGPLHDVCYVHAVGITAQQLS
jgi:SAM-dependent methyltransferase